MTDWAWDFVHRVICFVAGHRQDKQVNAHSHPLVEQLGGHISIAYLLICFRCGAVRCQSVSEAHL